MKKLLIGLISAVLILNNITIHNSSAIDNNKSIEIDVNKSYKVLRVVDADTIVIDNEGIEETVELLQIDCPELKYTDKLSDFSMGYTASKFTQDFLKHKKVTLKLDVEPRDKYGSLLAYVFVGDKCLNEELIKASLAKTVKDGKNTLNYKKYLDIEKKLRYKKQGIWKDIKANFPSEKINVANKTSKTNISQNKQVNFVSVSKGQGLIKGNKNSMIYHVPGGKSYNKVSEKNAVYFNTEKEAINAGFRKAKN